MRASRFSQVSKLWQGLGRSLSKRWFFLDFTCVTKPVPYSCVRGFIEVTNGGLKTAKLLNMVPRHLPRVVELVSRCVGLTDLLISQSGRIPFSKLALPNLETLNVLRSAKVALDTLLKVISSCPRLKEVAAIVLRPRNVNYTPPQVPQLQVLRLALCPNGGPGAFSAPFFKNVSSITLLTTAELDPFSRNIPIVIHNTHPYCVGRLRNQNTKSTNA